MLSDLFVLEVEWEFTIVMYNREVQFKKKNVNPDDSQ